MIAMTLLFSLGFLALMVGGYWMIGQAGRPPRATLRERRRARRDPRRERW